MFSFLDYMFEIWSVGAENGVDVGVAFLQFRSYVVSGFDGGNGEKALENINFSELEAKWDGMTEEEQSEAMAEWSNFVDRYYSEACALYVALTAEN